MEIVDFNEKRPANDLLPQEWPILSARHMHKGTLYKMLPVLSDRVGSDHNCACLIGWAGNVIEFWGSQYKDVISALETVIEDELKISSCAINNFNDRARVSKKLLARVWNRAGYLLEYTEGNPEDQPLEVAS